MALKIIQYSLHDIYPEIALNTIELLKENKTVCLFTMGKDKNVVLKILASVYMNIEVIRESVYMNIEVNKFLQNKLTDEEKQKVNKFEKLLNTKFKDNLYIFDNYRYSLEQIDTILQTLNDKNKTPFLVVIDDLIYIDFQGVIKDLYNQLNDLQNKFDVKLVVYENQHLWEMAKSL